jgi:hypothetical protein
MNFYNNIPSVLWEHVNFFEINLISMEYAKIFSRQCHQCFSLLKEFLKKTSNDLKIIFLSKQINYHLYNIFLDYKNFKN